jgi:hypothetical protein
MKERFIKEWNDGLRIVVLYLILNALNILYYLYVSGRLK